MKKKSTKPILLLVTAGLLSFQSEAQFTGVDLSINNVRTRINNNLSHFWDPNDNTTGIYEIPSGSGKNTIYAGSIWMGGYDISNNLHLSAQTYLQSGSNSYWPGPLDISNATAADPNVWNLIWKVNKTAVQNHIANWNTPGYVVPPEIADWPGNPPAGTNYMSIMAPFFDANNNQTYEPALGDFPFIYGDQAVYVICNDNFAVTSLGPNLKVEIHCMAWAFSDPATPSLDNTIFMRYQIANRSGIDYHDVSLGLWTDADLGDASDDYMGTDVGRNMQYFYNGDAFDGGASGYGANPPAQGIKMLNQTITSSVYYQNMNAIPSGNPGPADDYYQYMNGIWKDGVPVTFGGDGRGGGIGGTNSPSDFMFPGTSDPAFPVNWTMFNSGIQPDDMRGILSTGGHNLPANGVLTLDCAYITALSDSGGPDSSRVLLQAYADDIMLRYLNGTVTSIKENTQEPMGTISIYPNPMNDAAQLKFSNLNDEKGVLVITSIDGKELFQKDISSSSTVLIQKQELQSGIYIVTARFKTQTLYNKLVIK